MPGQFNLRSLLAGMAPAQPTSFEQLLMQERGDRDQAALRWNAMQGNPGSMAYSPAAAAPDPMATGAIPVPTPRPDTPPPVPIPTPRPAEILEDRATRDRSMVPSPAGPAEVGAVAPTPLQVPTPTPPRGRIIDYGSANRGARPGVKPGKKPQQFRLK